MNRKKRSVFKQTVAIVFATGILIMGSVETQAVEELEVPSYTIGEPTVSCSVPTANLQTDYCGAIGVRIKTLDKISAIYGEKAKDLFLIAMKTGDFYDYRTYTGNFSKSVYSDFLSKSTDPNEPLYCDTPFAREEMVFNALGPYATATDFMEWTAQYGITGESTWDAVLIFKAKYSSGTLPESGPHPTKADYIAKHRSAQAPAAPTSNNDAVERLKSYAGNNAEFNAYTYYTRYADLQTAIGANGDALLKHYNECGKAEGRTAN